MGLDEDRHAALATLRDELVQLTRAVSEIDPSLLPERDLERLRATVKAIRDTISSMAEGGAQEI